MLKVSTILVAASLCLTVHAHLAPFHKGMYCLNGNTGGQNLNSYDIVSPLYQLPFNQWWMHHVNRCDEFPPAQGDFLDLPAGGSFVVEIASNRAKTSLSYNSRDASEWPDGATYPENYNVPECIIHPNMHAQNRSMAAGTAFAISYQSDIKKVTPENLVVFSVRYNTPWKRVVWYDVPAALPACPPGGCICAWGWVPNGCGQPNIYMTPFRCRVTGAKSTSPVASPKPPVWCEGNPNGCTKGAKQMIYWNQAERNNVFVEGYDGSGQPKSPAYNSKLGFVDGAQNDIFSNAPTQVTVPVISQPNNGGSGGNSKDSTTGNSGSGSNETSGSGNGSNTNNNDNNDNAPSSPSLSSEKAPTSTSTSTSSNSNSNANQTTPNTTTETETEPEQFINHPPACKSKNGAGRRRRSLRRRGVVDKKRAVVPVVPRGHGAQAAARH